MKTKLNHPCLVTCDFQPWNTEEIPLPRQKRISTFSRHGALNWCKKVIQAHWVCEDVVLSGGGGSSAVICKLKDVYPTPQYHYSGDYEDNYCPAQWNIVAVLVFENAEDSPSNEPVFTPHLGSWKIRLLKS